MLFIVKKHAVMYLMFPHSNFDGWKWSNNFSQNSYFSSIYMFLKRLNPLIYPTESTRSSGETETKPKVEARGEAEESIKKVFILNKVG